MYIFDVVDLVSKFNALDNEKSAEHSFSTEIPILFDMLLKALPETQT